MPPCGGFNKGADSQPWASFVCQPTFDFPKDYGRLASNMCRGIIQRHHGMLNPWHNQNAGIIEYSLANISAPPRGCSTLGIECKPARIRLPQRLRAVVD